MSEYVRDTWSPRVIPTAQPGSWGTCEPGPGGAWSISVSGSGTRFWVSSGVGRCEWTSTNAGGLGLARLGSAPSVADVHGAFAFRPNAAMLACDSALFVRTGTGLTVGYGLRIARSGGNAVADLVRAPADAAVSLAPLPVIPWADSGTYMVGELEVTGASPTTIRGRVYPSTARPADDAGWTTITDSVGPQGAGVVGIRAARSGTVLGAAYLADLWIADPLRPAYTVSWDETGTVGTFDSDISTGDPASYEWDFGDGSGHDTTPNPTHQFPAAGAYVVKLTLTTKWSTKRSSTQTVTAPGGVPLPIPPVLPSIYINGQDVCDRIYSASWRIGRTRWPDDALGSTLSLAVRGTLPDVTAGAKVVIQTPPGTPGGIVDLWTGDIDAIAESIDPVDARTLTQITAMDVLSFLGRWHILPATSMPEGGLPTRVAALAPRTDIVYREKWAGVASSRWPTLKSLVMTADKLRDRTYLDILRDGLRASIATAYAAPNGDIVYAPLDPPAGLTPPILDLDISGPNCPEHVDRQRQSPEGIVNRWTVGDGAAVDRVDRPSIEAYGESSWTVGSGVLKSDATFPLTDELFDGMRNPFAAGQVTIPMRDWTSTAYKAQPLDSAQLQGILYGILGASHQIDYQGGWTVELTLDRDPWSLSGTVPPITPPAILTATETFLCDRDALLASPDLGAGKSGRAPVGYWEGTKFRSLFRFDLDFAHTPTKIVRADLLLTTAGQDMVGYGSPSVHVDRVTQSWAEGSAGSTSPPWTFSTQNSVVYPGPSCTTSGRKSFNHSGGEGVDLELAITEITRAWISGSANYGVRVMAQSESSSGDTTEYYSREYGTSSKRPRLRVTYEYQA